MTKNEIQEERMKGYFIQATKEILKGEGLKSISVRNIAERAGYSYATLYNYFKDSKELVFECVKDFLEECETIVGSATRNSPRGLIKIKAITKAYVMYFVQYPGTFELLFIEKVNDLAGKQPTIELITSFLQKLCKDEWDFCISNNLISNEGAGLINEQLNYSVVGLLLLYLHRRYPSSFEEFRTLLDKHLDKILFDK